MATKQIKDYSAKTALVSTDQLLIQESGDTTKKTTIAALGTIDGWIPVAETWTYASADDPTYTFTITGNYTARYSVGMKIKLTQTTVKYFIITAISYSDPDTTVTVYGGTDYDLANAAITLPYYSMVKAPFGFPMSPTKWRITLSDGEDKTKNNPVASTVYGGANAWDSGANVTIDVPIGLWDVDFSNIDITASKSGAICDIRGGLSTSNSAISGSPIWPVLSGYDTIRYSTSHSGLLSVAAKTTYYMVFYTSVSSVSYIRVYNMTCYFYCAYL
jgi:hypothetical protein